MRAQHVFPVVVHVRPFERRLGRGTARLAQSRRHLRQLHETGVPQHQADVRVCDQPPLLIDHIGITVAPDLQPTDDIPDQLEIHIGDGDTGISAGPGNGNGQVGLGLVAEVHRTERDLAGQRIDEQRVVRKIRPAGDHIHGQPGHLELFLAGRVKLSQFGDRRHLAQQPHIVEAALVDTAGGPLSLRGPADLAFDLTDELRDAAVPRRRPSPVAAAPE